MSATFAGQQPPHRKPGYQWLFRACACCGGPAAPTSPARRKFLAGGVAALGLGATAAAAKPAAAQTAPARVDVHHHYVPPVHAAAMGQNRVNGPPPQWTVQLSFADMEKAGVSKAVLSLVPPGVWFGDAAAARKLARECNEFGAGMAHDYPGRFGMFAALPLPDTRAACARSPTPSIPSRAADFDCRQRSGC